jgi:hypothetical protein
MGVELFRHISKKIGDGQMLGTEFLTLSAVIAEGGIRGKTCNSTVTKHIYQCCPLIPEHMPVVIHL